MIVITQPKAPIFVIGIPSPIPVPDKLWVDTNGTPIVDANGNYIILNPIAEGVPDHGWLDTSNVPIEDAAGNNIILNSPK
jgi:hypothetical protein